jgi:hypothetical protein
MQSFEAIGDVIALVAIITFLGRAMAVQYIIHEIHRLCNTVQYSSYTSARSYVDQS